MNAMDPAPTATASRPGASRPGASGPGASRPGVSGSDRPRLARHVRLTFDRTRQRPILLLPETVVVLNDSGEAILRLCDGRRTVAEVVAELGAHYRTVPDDEVRRFLTRLVARRCVVLGDG